MSGTIKSLSRTQASQKPPQPKLRGFLLSSLARRQPRGQAAPKLPRKLAQDLHLGAPSGTAQKLPLRLFRESSSAQPSRTSRQAHGARSHQATFELGSFGLHPTVDDVCIWLSGGRRDDDQLRRGGDLRRGRGKTGRARRHWLFFFNHFRAEMAATIVQLG